MANQQGVYQLAAAPGGTMKGHPVQGLAAPRVHPQAQPITPFTHGVQFRHANCSKLHDARLHNVPHGIDYYTEFYYEGDNQGFPVVELVRVTHRQGDCLTVERYAVGNTWYTIGTFKGLVTVAHFLRSLQPVPGIPTVHGTNRDIGPTPLAQCHAYNPANDAIAPNLYLGTVVDLRRSFCRAIGYARW